MLLRSGDQTVFLVRRVTDATFKLNLICPCVKQTNDGVSAPNALWAQLRLSRENANMNKTKHAVDPEETPDIVPDHPLTGKAAEEDYQKQLALLEEQNKTRLEKARESPFPNSSIKNTDRRT
ncbi:hypothetical protein FCOIX_7357 [Fusarium coicis]|nr:hypothetical protein FCOIX_7357 [Fusarium coicis]